MHCAVSLRMFHVKPSPIWLPSNRSFANGRRASISPLHPRLPAFGRAISSTARSSSRLKPNARRWLDLGSGGGFPGLVIAILQKGRDGARVDLVESAGKKAAFLRLAAGTLGIPAKVHQCRIEAAASQIATPEIVTARALAALPKLFELSEPWLADGATGLFQKGRDYRREVEAGRYAWTFDLVEHPSVTEPDAAILEIAGLKRQVAGRST